MDLCLGTGEEGGSIITFVKALSISLGLETSSMGSIYPNSQAYSFKVDVFVSVSRHSFFRIKRDFSLNVCIYVWLHSKKFSEN